MKPSFARSVSRRGDLVPADASFTKRNVKRCRSGRERRRRNSIEAPNDLIRHEVVLGASNSVDKEIREKQPYEQRETQRSGPDEHSVTLKFTQMLRDGPCFA